MYEEYRVKYGLSCHLVDVDHVLACQHLQASGCVLAVVAALVGLIGLISLIGLIGSVSPIGSWFPERSVAMSDAQVRAAAYGIVHVGLSKTDGRNEGMPECHLRGDG